MPQALRALEAALLAQCIQWLRCAETEVTCSLSSDKWHQCQVAVRVNTQNGPLKHPAALTWWYIPLCYYRPSCVMQMLRCACASSYPIDFKRGLDDRWVWPSLFWTHILLQSVPTESYMVTPCDLSKYVIRKVSWLMFLLRFYPILHITFYASWTISDIDACRTYLHRFFFNGYIFLLLIIFMPILRFAHRSGMLHRTCNENEQISVSCCIW